MMRLADVNNIKLGYPRTTQSKHEANVPFSYPQRQRANVPDEDEEELEGDVDQIKKKQQKYVDELQIANSIAPYKDTPDIRKPPNKPDTVGA